MPVYLCCCLVPTAAPFRIFTIGCMTAISDTTGMNLVQIFHHPKSQKQTKPPSSIPLLYDFLESRVKVAAFRNSCASED